MRTGSILAVLCLSAGILALNSSEARAHCDTLDGPVVTAAKRAVESGNVNLILIWVQKDDEAAIRESFNHASAVRKLGPQARELADRHFFETLVRVHRAGEGAPFTGLKPAGSPSEPGIAAADLAIDKGSADELLGSLRKETEREIRKRFGALTAAKTFDKNDVEGGRKYVRAYVEFIHFVERLSGSLRGPAHGHYSESKGSEAEEHHPSPNPR